MSRLGLRALLQATCEAWDQVEGPSLGAAVLAIVRERPRLRAIISDMREGIESLKADLDEAARQQVEVFHKQQHGQLESKKQEQILKTTLADVRLQRDRAEQEVERLATDLAQAGAAADSLLTGLEDCRHALADMTSERNNLRASLTVMEAEVARLQVHKNAKDKPCPQPGDVVPWAEVEDGALYHRLGERCPFRMSVGGRVGAMYDADDRDILRMVAGTFGAGDPEFENHTAEHPLILVARNLGSDPEAWRAAMREWTANGNRPSVDPQPHSCAVTSREDAT